MKELSLTLAKGLLPYFALLIVALIVIYILIRIRNNAVIKINKKIASVKTGGGICPKCGGQLIMRTGKYGNFIGCSNFPKCRYTQK